MPRRAATLTQADVARAIRAAKQAGATDVEIRPNGSIVVHLVPQPGEGADDDAVDQRKEIVL